MEDDNISQEARRRAARYLRQPSVWTPPDPAPARPTRAGSPVAKVLRTAVAAVVLLGGPPWLLWVGFGNPVTVFSSWWTTDPFSTPTSVAPTAGLRVVLIWAGWLAWAVLAILLVGSLAGVLLGRRLPRWHLPMPLHRLVVGLTGTATVALVAAPATAAMAASPASQAAPAPAYAHSNLAVQPGSVIAPPAPMRHDTDSLEMADPHGDLVTITVEHARYHYVVRRGDTLSKIAKAWLGEADRWPEICTLNKHRHVIGGQRLIDCDLIYPGWNLQMPAGAVAPPDAKPERPPRAPSRPAPSRPASPRQHSEPGATATPTVSPTRVPTDSDTGAPHSATPAPATAGSGQDDDTRDAAGGDLVLPGGSIIPWTLAAAITATAALVWLQRRRRFRLDSDDDSDLTEFAAPVRAAQRHTRHTRPPAEAEPDPATGLPSGGIGLVGSGADGVARGLIIAALTAGAPAEPALRAEVIIDRPTLTALIGDMPITGWQRMQITDSLDQALTLLDTHLLRRARLLDEHSLTDLDTLRATAPSEQALPPLLLITGNEQAAASKRAHITFGLTHGLDITAVILGHWPHGPVLSVSDDGQAQPETGGQVTRMAVLDIATTRDLLDTVREAHTGEHPHAAQQTPAPPSTSGTATTGPAVTVPLQDRASSDTTESTPPMATAPSRARLRVLGKPRIEDITADGRPLRAKALELAVYLAVHPDGASTREIGEYLEPDARVSQADQRVHTNASNLRHVLGRAGTADTKNAYVIKTAGRYRLDPATVEVDVWTLRELIRSATIAAEPRRRDLLTAACDLCTAPLAEGHDYEWVQPHRETIRRWATEAHLMLANDLLGSNPQAASDLLDKAIHLDRYSEALYTTAMHARHALGDSDGIRTLLRALTKALADLDTEPQEATIELARRLRGTLDGKQ